MLKSTSALFLLVVALGTNCASQNLDWAGHLSASTTAQALDIAFDGSGNSLVTGFFEGTMDADPGTAVTSLVSAGQGDIFVSQYNASGGLVWAVRIGGAGSEKGVGIASDAAGNVLVTGEFRGSVDFDPGAGVVNLDPGTSTTGSTIFVLKLNPAGSFVWAKSFPCGNFSGAVGGGVEVDASGNVFTYGNFGGNVDFDPGAATANLASVNFASPSGDVFVSKLTSSGNYAWAKSIGSTQSQQVFGLDTDASGNAVLTGLISETTDFDPGPGTYNLATGGIGYPNAYIWKLTSSGSLAWAKVFTSPQISRGSGISVDPSGNVLTAGEFSGSTDFDPGNGTFILPGLPSSLQGYLSKLDASGNFIWAKHLEGEVTTADVATDVAGNLFTAGKFAGTMDFDPGAGTYMVTSANFYGDIFISKFDGLGNLDWMDQVTASSPYELNGLALDASGNAGAVGIFKSSIDIDPCSSTKVLTATTNDFDGFILNLGTCSPTSANFTQTACDSFVANGEAFYTSGVFTQTIPNSACCDSLITWNLTITTVNVAVQQSSNTLTAQLPGAAYQWIDCTNGNLPIPGANNQVYVAQAIGDYAVIVTENGCSDTSICITVSTVGSVEPSQISSLRVFPNPTTGLISVETPYPGEAGRIWVLNMMGSIVLESAHSGAEAAHVDLSGLPAGLYLVQVEQRLKVGRSLVVKGQ